MADKLLKSIKFPTLPDRYVIGDTSLSEEGAAADAKAVGEALATKADTKGTYEDLIVGGAEQLMSDEYETDKEPYLFRTTGGSADVGNREYLDKIVGGTVAWNQLAKYDEGTGTIGGLTYTVSSDGSVTFSAGTATGIVGFNGVQFSGRKNHVIYISGCPNGGADGKYYFRDGYQAGSNNLDTGNGRIIKKTSDNLIAQIYIASGITVPTLTFKPKLIDLTAMFGTTIADYIYSLEQANAGAGVAWFRNYFQKDYYPYDPGTLRSVEGVSAHETVGFNQFDKDSSELLQDKITTANGTVNTLYTAFTTPFIRVLPNTTYYCNHILGSSSTSVAYVEFDSGKNYIGVGSVGYGGNVGIGGKEATFTTSKNANYIKFNGSLKAIDETNLNISDPSRNGEYEPYQKHTYTLDSSLTLRGVPKLVDGKLAFDGDVYPPSGEVQRRYGIVDLGTLDWSYASNFNRFISGTLKGVIVSATSDNGDSNVGAICSHYVRAGSYIATAQPQNNKSFGIGDNGAITVRDESYTDAASFKAAMSGVYLVYEKATPTTETADGYDHYQICDPSGTEEFVTDSIVPVGHETRYPHDLKKKIETAPDSPSTDGTYLMKRSGGKNTYMALPSTPSANGAYVLTVTVSGGTASYSWAAKE